MLRKLIQSPRILFFLFLVFTLMTTLLTRLFAAAGYRPIAQNADVLLFLQMGFSVVAFVSLGLALRILIARLSGSKARRGFTALVIVCVAALLTLFATTEVYSVAVTGWLDCGWELKSTLTYAEPARYFNVYDEGCGTGGEGRGLSVVAAPLWILPFERVLLSLNQEPGKFFASRRDGNVVTVMYGSRSARIDLATGLVLP